MIVSVSLPLPKNQAHSRSLGSISPAIFALMSATVYPFHILNAPTIFVIKEDSDIFFSPQWEDSDSGINLVQAVTISANGWSDAGHAVNQIYDILYMMDRDDIAVGVGGNGGILEDGTILPNVGGYLPLIEQV